MLQDNNLSGEKNKSVYSTINPSQLHHSSSPRPHLGVQHVYVGSEWQNQPKHVLDLWSYCEVSSWRKIRTRSVHSVHCCPPCLQPSPAARPSPTAPHFCCLRTSPPPARGCPQSVPTTVRRGEMKSERPVWIFKIVYDYGCWSWVLM